MRLIDSHCHLQHERFDGDRTEVIERAREAGVERLLVPGWDLASSVAALALTSRHEWLDAAVGIHPHEAGRADAAAWHGVERLAHDQRVVAIGETGLDYDRMFSPIDDQRANVRRHLELGQELDKPVVLHCRSTEGSTAAHDDLLDELDRAGIRARRAHRPPAAIMHSFSGSVEFAREVLALGLAISVSGLAFRAGEEPTAEVVALTPLDRLLVETDAPFLTPPGVPKGRNEPAWVTVTTGWLVERRGLDTEASGPDLVATYDATFRSSRVSLSRPS